MWVKIKDINSSQFEQALANVLGRQNAHAHFRRSINWFKVLK